MPNINYDESTYCSGCEIILPRETRLCPDCNIMVRHGPIRGPHIRLTKEELSRAAKVGWSKISKEDRSARMKKAWITRKLSL